MYAGSCLLLIEEKIESYQRRVVLGLVGGGLQSSNLRYELVFFHVYQEHEGSISRYF